MLFVLLPSLQFTDDISSKHTHLFQIRGNTIKSYRKSRATRQKSTILLYYERNAEKPLLLILVRIQNLRN